MPWDSRTYHEQANKNRESREHVKAQRNYVKSIEFKRTELATIYVDKAKNSRMMRHYGRALDELHIAYELSPTLSSIANERANVNAMLDKFDEAVEDYQKAISMDDKNIFAYYNLGVLCYHNRMGMLNETYDFGIECDFGLKYFDKVIEIFNVEHGHKQRENLYRDKVVSLSYYFKGLIHLFCVKDCSMDSIVDYFETSIKFNTNSKFKKLPAYFLCGVSNLILNKHDKAIHFLTDAINFSTNSKSKLKAYYCRGLAYLRCCEYDKALDDFNMMTDLDDILDYNASHMDKRTLFDDDLNSIKQEAYYCSGLVYFEKARVSKVYFTNAIQNFIRVTQFYDLVNEVMMHAYNSCGLAYMQIDDSKEMSDKYFRSAGKINKKLGSMSEKIDKEWQPDLLSLISNAKSNLEDFLL